MARKKALNKLIVEKFVKKECILWPREMKIANALIERYPDYAFWQSIFFDFKLNSLAWFVGEGKSDLFMKWTIYKFDVPKQNSYTQFEYPLSDKKIGEDYVASNKPKNMKDFLKLW